LSQGSGLNLPRSEPEFATLAFWRPNQKLIKTQAQRFTDVAQFVGIDTPRHIFHVRDGGPADAQPCGQVFLREPQAVPLSSDRASDSQGKSIRHGHRIVSIAPDL
jgi:hypothetical protein